jgi:hypothetical protein
VFTSMNFGPTEFINGSKIVPESRQQAANIDELAAKQTFDQATKLSIEPVTYPNINGGQKLLYISQWLGEPQLYARNIETQLNSISWLRYLFTGVERSNGLCLRNQ